jgi:hypothetical protein
VTTNYFELSIPPFFGLHLVFNVELLRPYFPPLLDTLEVDKKLAPIKLSFNYLEKATMDQIIDAKMKGTNQQNIQIYQVIKVGQLIQQGKCLTKIRIQQKSPYILRELEAMGTISS